MNRREAILAMLDGKVVVADRNQYRYTDFSGFQTRLTHENEWQKCAFQPSVDEWTELNPYPQGSFKWAMEENKRGAAVYRYRKNAAHKFFIGPNFRNLETTVFFTIQDFEAMDWQCSSSIY